MLIIFVVVSLVAPRLSRGSGVVCVRSAEDSRAPGVAAVPWLVFSAVGFDTATGNSLNTAFRGWCLLPLRFSGRLVRRKVPNHLSFLRHACFLFAANCAGADADLFIGRRSAGQPGRRVNAI